MGGWQNDLADFQGVISRWNSEEDNNAIIAFYTDDKCCHTTKLQTITWTDGCFELMAGAKSLRVLNPEEPDRGIEGETYIC
jgi:hypothetical protein